MTNEIVYFLANFQKQPLTEVPYKKRVHVRVLRRLCMYILVMITVLFNL